jgi:hypothetical protein
MKTALLVTLAAAMAAVVCGCSTPSINPLYSDEESEVVIDDRVVGTWVKEDKQEQDRYHVSPRKDDKSKWYAVRIGEPGSAAGGVAAPGQGKHGLYEMRLVRLGAHTYADFHPAESERKNMLERLGLAAFPMHVIFPVTIGAEQVTLRTLDNAKVRALVEASPKMTPHAMQDDVVVLTGTTRQVQEFFRRIVDGEEVFGEPAVLKRAEAEAEGASPPKPEDKDRRNPGGPARRGR